MREFSLSDRTIITAFVKAFEHGELAVELPNMKLAIVHRARAYAVAKMVRNDAARSDADSDRALGVAASEVMLQLEEKDGKAYVHYRRRDQDASMQALLKAIGGPDEVIDPVKNAMEESLERVREKLAESQPGERSAIDKYLGGSR